MIQIIPAIDIIDGKCVRLTEGDYTRKTVYNQNPLVVARQFEEAGFSRLHLVDLDGARLGKVTNLAVLESIAAGTRLTIDFGGGIKTDSDLEAVFGAGAAIATVGSIAVKQPGLFYSWIKKYSSEKILLGADVRDERVVISGWAEDSGISIFDFIKTALDHGITRLFCTDVSKDGLLQGPSVQLYRQITERFPALDLIASGGVSSVKDIDDLERAGCTGVIVGKAIYEGKIDLQDLTAFMR